MRLSTYPYVRSGIYYSDEDQGNGDDFDDGLYEHVRRIRHVPARRNMGAALAMPQPRHPAVPGLAGLQDRMGRIAQLADNTRAIRQAMQAGLQAARARIEAVAAGNAAEAVRLLPHHRAAAQVADARRAVLPRARLGNVNVDGLDVGGRAAPLPRPGPPPPARLNLPGAPDARRARLVAGRQPLPAPALRAARPPAGAAPRAGPPRDNAPRFAAAAAAPLAAPLPPFFALPHELPVEVAAAPARAPAVARVRPAHAAPAAPAARNPVLRPIPLPQGGQEYLANLLQAHHGRAAPAGRHYVVDLDGESDESDDDFSVDEYLDEDDRRDHEDFIVDSDASSVGRAARRGGRAAREDARRARRAAGRA